MKMEKKIIIALEILMVLIFSSLALAYETQFHPLSEIHPIDINLDMFRYNITNVSYVGIGTTSPVKQLDVVGDINATSYVYGMSGLCIGTDCKTTWSQVGGGVWDNSTSQIFVRSDYPTYINASNTLFVNGSSGSVGIGTTSPIAKLEIQGSGTGGLSLNVTNDLFVNDTSGYVGIGTTNPEYKLDVSGNIRAQTSITAGINVESLTGDKTLTPGQDKMYQWLAPNGANRIIYLNTSTAKAGDRFVIRNNDYWSSYYYLQIKQGDTVLDNIYAQSIREYIFDGTNWVAGDVGTRISGDYNVALGYAASGQYGGTAVGYEANGGGFGGTAVGYQAKGYNYGTALGFRAYGYDYGVAVGYEADGFNYGAAVGINAYGYNYGAAVGSGAIGSNSGASLGYNAHSDTSGAAVGYQAYGYNYGAAVGYQADGSRYGAAIGYQAKGRRYGVAVGYQAGYNTDLFSELYNTLIGAYSGYRLTTGVGNIILGYQSGYDPTYSPITGSYNILIGYNAWTPANDTSNFLNIGGLIFGTNLSTTVNNISSGNIGIGTTNPVEKLDVVGAIKIGNTESSCDSTHAGVLKFVPGGSGTDDKLYMCMKNSTDSYVWVLVARGG